MRTVSIKTREPEYRSLETEKPSKISIRTKVELRRLTRTGH